MPVDLLQPRWKVVQHFARFCVRFAIPVLFPQNGKMSTYTVPWIISGPQDIGSSLGQGLALDCEVKGYPIPSIHWEFKADDGTSRMLPIPRLQCILPPTSISLQNSLFHVSCELEPLQGISAQSFSDEIVRFFVSFDNVGLTTNNLSVALIKEDSQYWVFDSHGRGDDLYMAVQVRGGPEPYMATSWVQIVSLRHKDTGTYTCVATNTEGVVRASAQVGVRG
uniref:Ig-like domain-containing protein n=1 Tax=Timema bartmani TaxID=61472 RepID=A0A7R9EVP4_9NEOP|nr:unnamed protein product [Timema bartmani]